MHELKLVDDSSLARLAADEQIKEAGRSLASGQRQVISFEHSDDKSLKNKYYFVVQDGEIFSGKNADTSKRKFKQFWKKSSETPCDVSLGGSNGEHETEQMLLNSVLVAGQLPLDIVVKTLMKYPAHGAAILHKIYERNPARFEAIVKEIKNQERQPRRQRQQVQAIESSGSDVEINTDQNISQQLATVGIGAASEVQTNTVGSHVNDATESDGDYVVTQEQSVFTELRQYNTESYVQCLLVLSKAEPESLDVVTSILMDSPQDGAGILHKIRKRTPDNFAIIVKEIRAKERIRQPQHQSVITELRCRNTESYAQCLKVVAAKEPEFVAKMLPQLSATELNKTVFLLSQAESGNSASAIEPELPMVLRHLTETDITAIFHNGCQVEETQSTTSEDKALFTYSNGVRLILTRISREQFITVFNRLPIYDKAVMISLFHKRDLDSVIVHTPNLLSDFSKTEQRVMLSVLSQGKVSISGFKTLEDAQEFVKKHGVIKDKYFFPKQVEVNGAFEPIGGIPHKILLLDLSNANKQRQSELVRVVVDSMEGKYVVPILGLQDQPLEQQQQTQPLEPVQSKKQVEEKSLVTTTITRERAVSEPDYEASDEDSRAGANRKRSKSTSEQVDPLASFNVSPTEASPIHKAFNEGEEEVVVKQKQTQRQQQVQEEARQQRRQRRTDRKRVVPSIAPEDFRTEETWITQSQPDESIMKFMGVDVKQQDVLKVPSIIPLNIKPDQSIVVKKSEPLEPQSIPADAPLEDYIETSDGEDDADFNFADILPRLSEARPDDSEEVDTERSLQPMSLQPLSLNQPLSLSMPSSGLDDTALPQEQSLDWQDNDPQVSLTLQTQMAAAEVAVVQNVVSKQVETSLTRADIDSLSGEVQSEAKKLELDLDVELPESILAVFHQAMQTRTFEELCVQAGNFMVEANLFVDEAESRSKELTYLQKRRLRNCLTHLMARACLLEQDGEAVDMKLGRIERGGKRALGAKAIKLVEMRNYLDSNGLNGVVKRSTIGNLFTGFVQNALNVADHPQAAQVKQIHQQRLSEKLSTKAFNISVKSRLSIEDPLEDTLGKLDGVKAKKSKPAKTGKIELLAQLKESDYGDVKDLATMGSATVTELRQQRMTAAQAKADTSLDKYIDEVAPLLSNLAEELDQLEDAAEQYDQDYLNAVSIPKEAEIEHITRLQQIEELQAHHDALAELERLIKNIKSLLRAEATLREELEEFDEETRTKDVQSIEFLFHPVYEEQVRLRKQALMLDFDATQRKTVTHNNKRKLLQPTQISSHIPELVEIQVRKLVPERADPDGTTDEYLQLKGAVEFEVEKVYCEGLLSAFGAEKFGNLSAVDENHMTHAHRAALRDHLMLNCDLPLSRPQKRRFYEIVKEMEEINTNATCTLQEFQKDLRFITKPCTKEVMLYLAQKEPDLFVQLITELDYSQLTAEGLQGIFYGCRLLTSPEFMEQFDGHQNLVEFLKLNPVSIDISEQHMEQIKTSVVTYASTLQRDGKTGIATKPEGADFEILPYPKYEKFDVTDKACQALGALQVASAFINAYRDFCLAAISEEQKPPKQTEEQELEAFYAEQELLETNALKLKALNNNVVYCGTEVLRLSQPDFKSKKIWYTQYFCRNAVPGLTVVNTDMFQPRSGFIIRDKNPSVKWATAKQ
ncbi:hypothetical protein D5018_07845 [Parashewanella curva]|uniref:Uncharacterized protein n=1 Tax=Parashewanella curva TaxID=2338552 RepID=A0A3L8Q0I3_9GAMM|nr:hypothetical protein [Parashewanella curva]RLV60298.1 hypothetical protein D5018_07845 [Parashewanella curva]